MERLAKISGIEKQKGTEGEMSEGSFDREWTANKWLIRGTAFLANALLGVLIFIGLGLLNDMDDVKNSSADILNRQIKMEVQQDFNNDRILQLEIEFREYQKERYK
jgi:hypothetical protein